MFEQDLRLTMPDGTADAVLFSPIRPLLCRECCTCRYRQHREATGRWLAARGEGLRRVMPNPFYRSGRPPLFDFPARWVNLARCSGSRNWWVR